MTDRPTTWYPCPTCAVGVIDARHYTSGKALVLEAERVAEGKFKPLDHQDPRRPLAVRPLTPTELAGTSWGSKNYRVHKCEGRRR